MSASVGTAYVSIEPDFSGLNQKVRAQMAPLAKDFGGRFGKALGPVMEQQSKHLAAFSRAAKIATIGAAGLAAYGFKDVVEAGMQFEKQMDVNAAISEANRHQMALLEKQAIKLGKATFFSANETAQAQAELVKGGLKVKQVLGGGLPAALSLAEAGQLDLTTAAETTVNAMKLFGLEGKEASSVADMLSTAANRTTADVIDFAMALKQGGSVTKLAGYDMNETVTVLESLAEAGIKNSDAGTSMKAAVIQLLKPTKKQAKLAEELNLHLITQAGTLKSAVGLSKELRLATGDMTKAERAKTLATLAGTDGVRTLNALYMETPAHLRALEMANAKQGTAQEIANKKMDNFAGQLEQLKGSIETAEIQIYKGMAPALKVLAEEATEAANNVTAIFEDPRLSGSEKVEKAISTLSHELGGIWDRNEMTDHLVDALDAAIPVAAEHAGKLGFEAAKGFGKGFLHADPLGKAVMATWLLNFIGGRAAFVGTGRFFGLSIGKEIATTAAATAATEIAATGAITTAATSAAAASHWAPGAAWLGSGAAKQKAADATSRALLQDAFGGATMATMGAGLQKAEKTSALRALSTKLGRSSAAQFAGGFAGSVGGALKRIRWGRVGLVGIGIGLADLVMNDFEDRAKERSTNLGEALAANTTTALSDLPGALFDGGSRDWAAGTALNAILDQMRKKRIQISEETQRALQDELKSVDLNREQRKQLEGVFNLFREGRRLGVKVDAHMDPAKLRKIRQDFNFLKQGIGANMADINRVTKRAGRNIAATFGRDTAEGRKLTAQNMRATASAIKQQMERSGHETKQGMARVRELIRSANLLAPTRKQAQDFGDEWAAGMDHSKEITRKGVKAMIAEANKMPGPMRQVALQTWLDQIKQAKRSGDITVGEFRSLRSRALSEFGNIQKGGKAQSKGLADAWIGNVSRMVNTTGSALGVFVGNVNQALKSFGQDVHVDFIAKTVGGGEQKRQQGGFIVPGTGSGDTFRTALPPGSFIENREAVKALAFARGGLMPVALEPGERVYMPPEVKAIGQRVLESRNKAVPRFQKGGPLGGPEPQIIGPDPLRALGQSAIHKVYEGGQDYLRKHMGPKPGLGMFDGKPVSEWIIPILAWARQHGWGGSVSSGYRDPAEQIAAATAYGLGHYGSAGPLGSNHVGINYPRGAVDVTLAAQLAAILKGYPGKPNLVWGGPVMGDYVHFSATGHQLGGLVQSLAKGGALKDRELADAFRERAARVWAVAAGLYGASGRSMPNMSVRNLPKGYDALTAEDASGIKFDTTQAKSFLAGGDGAESALLHEWTHFFQDKEKANKPWLQEGGAEDFARWAGPQVYGSLGWPWHFVPYGPYAWWARNVIDAKGWDWVKRGQFMQAGGLIQKLNKGGWVKTGYTTYDEDGPGAFGDLMKGKGYAELGSATEGGSGTGIGFIAKALGMSGELPKDYPLDVKIGQKIATLFKRDRGYGQGDPYYSIDIHHLAWPDVGLSGNSKGDAFIRPADGAASGSHDIKKQIEGTYTKHKAGHTSPGGGTYAETTKGKYKVRTDKLNDFGSLPSNLHACTKELRERQKELGEYRAAYRQTKDPETKRALAANVKLLEARISALRKQRTRLLRQEATKKAVKKITEAAEFATWTKPNVGIFDKREDAYNLAQELAEQTVSLEPEEPSGAGQNWVKNVLEPYVNNVESPAFARVLGSESEWRNSIIGAESFAGERIEAWRGQIDQIHDRIEEIQGLRTANPKAWDKFKDLIPGLRQRMEALRGDITKTRTETLPEWEDTLGGVQGLGRAHDIRSSLPTEPTMEFGGNIFETQQAIKGLGLKVSQALQGVAPDTSERDSLLEEIARIANQRAAASEIALKVYGQFEDTYPPYAGKAHSGAIVPGPPAQERTMILRGQERIRTPEQELAMAGAIRGLGGEGGGMTLSIDQLIVHSDGSVTAKIGREEVRGIAREVVREDPALRLR